MKSRNSSRFFAQTEVVLTPKRTNASLFVCAMVIDSISVTPASAIALSTEEWGLKLVQRIAKADEGTTTTRKDVAGLDQPLDSLAGKQKKWNRTTETPHSPLSIAFRAPGSSPSSSPSRSSRVSHFPPSILVDSALEMIGKLNSRMDEMDRIAVLEREGMYDWMKEFARGCQAAVDDVTLVEEETRAEVVALRDDVTELKSEVEGLRNRLKEQREEEIAKEDATKKATEEMLESLRQQCRTVVDHLASQHLLDNLDSQASIIRLDTELKALRAEFHQREIRFAQYDEQRSAALLLADTARAKKQQEETMELVSTLVESRLNAGAKRTRDGLSAALRTIIPKLIKEALPQALENGIVGKSLFAINQCITRHDFHFEQILPHLDHLNKNIESLSNTTTAASLCYNTLAKDSAEFQESVKVELARTRDWEDRRFATVINAFEGRLRKDRVQIVGLQAQLDSLCRAGNIDPSLENWTEKRSHETGSDESPRRGEIEDQQQQSAHPNQNQLRPILFGHPTPTGLSSPFSSSSHPHIYAPSVVRSPSFSLRSISRPPSTSISGSR